MTHFRIPNPKSKTLNPKSLLPALACCFLLVRANAQTPRPLSLADAVRIARAGSPLGLAGQQRVLAADSRLRASGLLDNATITLAAPFGRDTSPFESPLLISQLIPLGDKIRQRIHAARADYGTSRFDYAATTADLTLNAQMAYFEAQRAETERRLAVETVANAQAFADAAQLQFTAGDVARSNVVRSRIELTRATQALQTAQTDAENRLATVRSLLNFPAAQPLALTDTLTYAPVNYALSDLQALALKNRPELQSAQQTREARLAALHLARLLDTPDMIVEARHNSYRIDAGSDSLRIGLVIPLFDYGRSRAEQKAAAAALSEQDYATAEAVRIAKLDVETAYRNLRLARTAVEAFQGGRLDQSKELLDMAQTGYKNGANTYLELLDAQNIYRSEQAEYVRALASWNEAKAALQRAVGGELP